MIVTSTPRQYIQQNPKSATALRLDGITGCWYAGTMEKLTVQVKAELLQRLRLVAITERKTLSEIVRGLVESYVRARETK